MSQVLTRSTWLPKPPAEVFPFFADAGNLARITPPELSFRILTPLPIEMGVGALIDYRLALFGVPFRWRTRISAWDPPRGFIDEQVRGPYGKWVHSHVFEEESGGTRMFDRVEYALPFDPLGRVALPWVRRRLERIFDYRTEVIAELLGGRAGPAGA
ncbi:MAG: SRPBCC family protein [Myxococcota bacterium]